MSKSLIFTAKLILMPFCILLTPVVYFNLKRNGISDGFWSDTKYWLTYLFDELRGRA